MKYVIYKLVQPDSVTEVTQESYGQKSTVRRDVLERLRIWAVEEEHSTMESAIAEIHNKKELLKGLDLVIIPTISVYWDGKID